MLQAMIMMKRVREEKEGEEALSLGALEAYGIKEVDILIKEAVDFCNDSNRSQKVNDKLGEAYAFRVPPLLHESSPPPLGCRYAGTFPVTSLSLLRLTPYSWTS